MSPSCACVKTNYECFCPLCIKYNSEFSSAEMLFSKRNKKKEEGEEKNKKGTLWA